MQPPTDDAPAPEASSPTPSGVLYQHEKKPDWGLAILAWERGPRRAFQFEDGKLRVFKKGYYEMMKEVDVPADRAARAVPALERALGRSVERRESESGSGSKRSGISFEEQLRIFKIQQPEGFAGSTWQKRRRGVDAARRLKRHRRPAIRRAKELVAPAEIDRALAEGRALETVRELSAMLGKTDLVTKKQLAPLDAMDEAAASALLTRLAELIRDPEVSALAVGRYLAAVSARERASWQLATAIPALADPENHACIRPATIKRQCAWMAPRLTITRWPDAQVYLRLRQMVLGVAEKLGEAEATPRDLFDVYDFMLDTLVPKARELLKH